MENDPEKSDTVSLVSICNKVHFASFVSEVIIYLEYSTLIFQIQY